LTKPAAALLNNNYYTAPGEKISMTRTKTCLNPNHSLLNDSGYILFGTFGNT